MQKRTAACTVFLFSSAEGRFSCQKTPVHPAAGISPRQAAAVSGRGRQVPTCCGRFRRAAAGSGVLHENKSLRLLFARWSRRRNACMRHGACRQAFLRLFRKTRKAFILSVFSFSGPCARRKPDRRRKKQCRAILRNSLCCARRLRPAPAPP